MADSTKQLSPRDYTQVLKSAYNGVDASIAVSGFLTGAVGNKVTLAISTTNAANDTETYSFFENTITLLYSIKIIYTDGTREIMLSAERTA